MSMKSNKVKVEDDKSYLKKIRKHEVSRSSSFAPSSQYIGRHYRAASISAATNILEKDALEKQNLECNSLKAAEMDLGPRGRKTRRANSLPTSNTKKYLIEGGTKLKEASKSKISHNIKEKRREVENKRLHHQRMSLDLSQMSDYADSEGEHKDRFSKHHSRRRRSADKSNSRVERISSQLAIRSVSNSPSAKITSCAYDSSITRRSSLQNFSPKAFASYDTVPENGHDIKNQGIRRRTSSAMFMRKASLGSNMIKKSEFIFSSDSPDNTSDLSPGDVSSHDKPISLLPLSTKIFTDSSHSNKSGKTSNYQLSNNKPNWIEGEKSHNETPGKERGEWNSFWQNYNSSLAALPRRFFYDDCPTPFYEPNTNGGIKPFEINSNSKQTELRKDHECISNKAVKKNGKDGEKRGIYLSNSEAKEVLYCSKKLAEILSCAVERQTSSNTKQSEKLLDGKNKSTAEDSEKPDNNKVGESARDVFL